MLNSNQLYSIGDGGSVNIYMLHQLLAKGSLFLRAIVNDYKFK